jgi:hypothetical protein
VQIPYCLALGIRMDISCHHITLAVVNPEAAITPSQLRKLMNPKDSWIRVHLIHAETGESIDGALLHLKLPKATEMSVHECGHDGVVDITRLHDGTFCIEDIDDEDAWELVSHEED